MSEEEHKRHQSRKRTYSWLLIFSVISGITGGSIAFVPNPLPHPEYVPTIVNGLVASMSILTAFALFSLTHFHSEIKDRNERWKYHTIAMLYLPILFLVLFSGIITGY